MNVLVYAGPGTSASSTNELRATLRTFLSLSHDVILANSKMLCDEPWMEFTALLVFPGGRDIPFQAELGGTANARIRTWVEGGGRLLGVCAGAYYASARIEFERGSDIEVVTERELGFFPGLCRGTVFPGFVYDSEAGAREVNLVLDRTAWRDYWLQAPATMQIYYNGGGAFIEPETHSNVTVLARYADLPERPAAGIHCLVGKGSAILWGVHPEHVMRPDPEGPLSATYSTDYQRQEQRRKNLFRATLCMLGLEVPEQEAEIPPVKPQMLCSDDTASLAPLIARLESLCGADKTFIDINDSFRIDFDGDVEGDGFLDLFRQPIHSDEHNGRQVAEKAPEERPTRTIIAFSKSLPPINVTPMFNLRHYFEARRKVAGGGSMTVGSTVLYGEVVTSTQTLLDKNPKFLTAIPDGLVSVASHQVSGRGRGANSWISPPGCLQFSLVLRLPTKHMSRVVFVQYLFGLAVVEAVRSQPGYGALGLRLKWPNDIYAETDSGMGFCVGLENFKKIGGILVYSTFTGDNFTLVVGCGVNTTVPKPTTSLNELITKHNEHTSNNLPLIKTETLLALILSQFEGMWLKFLIEGFKPFMDLYLERWLHSDRLVKLEQSNELVRIVGIEPNHGLLRTVRVQLDLRGQEVFGEPSMGYVDLQPDSNSFDMLTGLIKVKR